MIQNSKGPKEYGVKSPSPAAHFTSPQRLTLSSVSQDVLFTHSILKSLIATERASPFLFRVAWIYGATIIYLTRPLLMKGYFGGFQSFVITTAAAINGVSGFIFHVQLKDESAPES